MSRTVLVVDDQLAIAASHAAHLEDEHDVATATGGHEALNLVKTLDPAVVLLDRRMPDLDGDEVLARLHE